MTMHDPQHSRAIRNAGRSRDNPAAGLFGASSEKDVQYPFRVRKERGFAAPAAPGKKLRKAGVIDVTKIWKKLQNPFALGAQGFLAGGLLFWTTRADAATVLAAIF